jgi:aspartate kinase
MCDANCEGYQTVVLKIGGSIFTDGESYKRAAQFLQRRRNSAPYEKIVVVVSAQNGATDDLEETARRIADAPASRALDLLWSTGELRSVALLSLHLQALGISAVGLNVQETGLRLDGSGKSPLHAQFETDVLHDALAEHAVVVVPGFLATMARGAIVSLGRGGSDLTAVLIARGLRAARCELVKDVAGYFTADPNVDRSARHLPALSYEQALAMADDGCELVQRQAIEAAQSGRLPLVIHSLDEKSTSSLVSGAPIEKHKTATPRDATVAV